MQHTTNKPGFGASAYEFTVSSAGYYYVEVIGLSSSSVSYKIAVGGPTYTLDDYTVSLGKATFDYEDLYAELPFENFSFPDDAIAYTISINGVSSSSTNGVTITNSRSSSKISMSASNLTKTGLVYSNMPMCATWEVTFKYKKSTTISPRITFYYVYPITF